MNTQNRCKVAVCFSGYPRFYDRLDLSDYGDADFYLHSWYDKIEDAHKESCVSSFTERMKCFEYIANKDLIDFIKPKTYILESYKENEDRFNYIYKRFRNCEGITRKSVLPMYYSVKKSIELALNSTTKYDIIVRTRFDLKLEQKIKYVKDHRIHIPDQFHFFGLNDQFAYGSPLVMKKYAGIYDYLSTYPDIQLNPETILKRYLYKNNIEVGLTEDWYYLLR